MLVEVIKPIQGKAYFEGDVISLSEEESRALIEAGLVIPAMSTVETAENSPIENASLKTAKGKGKK